MGGPEALAKFKASGSITAALIGLDDLMTKLQTRIAEGSKESASQEAKDQASFDQGAMMGLTMVQAMGTPDGKNRTYTFELGEDGTMKLNGVDYSGLLGGLLAPRHGSYQDESYDEPSMGGEEGTTGEDLGGMEDDSTVVPDETQPLPAPTE